METKASGIESVTKIFPSLPRASEELGGQAGQGTTVPLEVVRVWALLLMAKWPREAGSPLGAAPGLPLYNIRPSVWMSISQACVI